VAGSSKANERDSADRGVSDADLLRRHLHGDGEAFAALIRRYRRELFNFLARFTGDAALADDVFQETFLQLHLSAAAFDPKRRLKPWLFTIAANKARDAMRNLARKRTAELDAEIPTGDDEASYLAVMPSDVPPPDEAMVNFEARRAVQNMISDMPEKLRTVLLLSYFHEFPYAEIAEILNVPLGTVKSRLHAAVRYFARQWKAAAERTGHE